MGLCAQIVWTNLEFQFMATVFMSMAAKLSDLDDQKSRVNIWTEGHTLTPPSSQNDLEETETSGSAPSQLPSQSWVRKPMPDCPETWYCLGIELALTKEVGAAQPPSHTWQAPVIEDMVWEAKSDLTEAVVTGPGRVVLFYGRQFLGEGLSLGEVRDAVFTLSEAISWVGKLAQLHAIPMSLREGWQVIVQAIKECQIEARGPGCPWSCPVISQPFIFYQREDSPPEGRFHSTNECIEEPAPVHWPPHHRLQQDLGHGIWTSGWYDFRPSCLHHTEDPRVTAQCQWPLQCHQGLTGLRSLSTHVMANAKGRLVAIWRSTYRSSKMNTQRTQSPTKVGSGT